MINLSRSLAILPACECLLSCGRVLLLPRVTFYVVNYLFVMAHDKPKSYLLLHVLCAGGSVGGMSKAVGISCGFLGLSLMLYITSSFCGLWVWSP